MTTQIDTNMNFDNVNQTPTQKNVKSKYLHVFPSELKFSVTLIQSIQDPDNELYPLNHTFVTYSKATYDKLKEVDKMDKVILYNAEEGTYPIYDIINKWGDNYDWIFLHSIGRYQDLYKIKRKYYKKIIWRTWGHDTGYDLSQGRPYKKAIKYLYNRLVIGGFVRNIRAIGVANFVDIVAFERKGYKNEFRELAYLNRANYETVKRNEPNIIKENCLNISIGHSAYDNENHFQIIDLLEKFKSENIKVYLMLSYGDQNLKKHVIKYAREKLGEDKIVIVDEFMPFADYYALICKMNIAFLAGRDSYALGNVSILLKEGKTIYLSQDGVLHAAFKAKNIPHRCVEELKNINFKEFSTLCEDVRNNLSNARTFNYALCLWRDLLEELDSEIYRD